jgi:excisionase family DNA binding protein
MSPPVVETRFLTTREAARLLGVSAPAVAQWVERGLLRAHRTPGGHRRIRAEDLVALSGAARSEVAVAVPCGALVVLDADADRAGRFAAEASEVHGVRVAWVRSAFEAGLWLARLEAVALLVDGGMPGVDPEALARALGATPAGRGVPVLVTGTRDDALSLSGPVADVLAVVAARIRGYRARNGPVRSRDVGATSGSG